MERDRMQAACCRASCKFCKKKGLEAHPYQHALKLQEPGLQAPCYMPVRHCPTCLLASTPWHSAGMMSQALGQHAQPQSHLLDMARLAMLPSRPAQRLSALPIGPIHWPHLRRSPLPLQPLLSLRPTQIHILQAPCSHQKNHDRVSPQLPRI